jgi:hypothetical protein
MTAWDIPDGAFFTHPDLPHRCLHKHWNCEAWGSVCATNEELGLLLLKGDMPAIELPRLAPSAATPANLE